MLRPVNCGQYSCRDDLILAFQGFAFQLPHLTESLGDWQTYCSGLYLRPQHNGLHAPNVDWTVNCHAGDYDNSQMKTVLYCLDKKCLI